MTDDELAHDWNEAAGFGLRQASQPTEGVNMDDQNMHTYGEHYAEITEAILRDVCELDPANPSLNDTICIDISDLKIIVDRALLNAQIEQAAQPVMVQFRWTNPGDNPRPSEYEMSWQEVTTRNGIQSLQDRIGELLAYQYNGKPCYEIRSLYTSPPKAAPLTGGDERRHVICLCPDCTTAKPTAQPLTEAQIEKAAKALSYCMDYPWEHMPEAGRLNMRKNARTVIEAAIVTPATVEKE